MIKVKNVHIHTEIKRNFLKNMNFEKKQGEIFVFRIRGGKSTLKKSL